MMPRRGLSSSVLDQVVYSVASLLAVLSVSRSFEADSFGFFMLAYTAAAVCVAAARSYFGIDLARTSDELTELRQLRFKRYWSAVAAISPGLVVFVIALSIAVGQSGLTSVDYWLIAMVGVSVPAWVLHDLTRYFLSGFRSGANLFADVTRLAGLVVCFLIGLKFGLGAFVTVWVTSHVGSCIASTAAVGFRPFVRSWKRGFGGLRWTIRESVTAVSMLSAVVPLIGTSLMASVFSASDLGAWRGATTLFGPLNTMIMFLDFAVLGRYVRMGPTSRQRVTLRLAWVCGSVALVWGFGCWLVLPDFVGETFLGSSWATAKDYLPIVAIEYCMLCVTAVLLLEFKAAEYSNSMFWNKITSSFVIVGVTLLVCVYVEDALFVATAGVAGAFVGLALATSTTLLKGRGRT